MTARSFIYYTIHFNIMYFRGQHIDKLHIITYPYLHSPEIFQGHILVIKSLAAPHTLTLCRECDTGNNHHINLIRRYRFAANRFHYTESTT